jgi:hypothetical protein
VTRVNVIAEGQTEVSFVNDVLAPELWPREVYLTAILIGVPGHKGGRPNYARLKKDVLIQLKQDPGVYCTTMLDLYGLGAGFPGTPLPANLTGIEKASRIEEAVKADICDTIPGRRPDIRFLPYIQLHEYEGLLFSDPSAFAASLDRPDLAQPFEAIRGEFATPEDIDDSPDGAPSKRVIRAHPRYRKVLQGTKAAHAIGMPSIRRECPHFRAWVERLEGLGTFRFPGA